MPGRAARPAPTTRPARTTPPTRTTRPAPTSDPAETRSVWKRLGWMLLIWSASVAALGALSLILRLWLKR
ncbi:MAG TPA: DUF2474 domain-containing protein [Steroidobacteraceae bacterium]